MVEFPFTNVCCLSYKHFQAENFPELEKIFRVFHDKLNLISIFFCKDIFGWKKII